MKALMEQALRIAIEGRKRHQQVQRRRRLEEARGGKPVKYNKLF